MSQANIPQDPTGSSGVQKSQQQTQRMAEGTDPQTMAHIIAHQWGKTNQEVLDYLNNLFVAAQKGQPIPKEMTPQQLLKSVKEEVGAMKKMVATLQDGLQYSGNNKALNQLKQAQTFLNQMSKALEAKPPTVSDEQMKTLDSLLSQLNQLAKLPPSRYQTQYWGEQMKLFAQLVKTTGKLLKPLQQEEAEMEAKYKGANAVDNAFDSLKNFFSVPNPKLTPQFFEDLQTLLTNQKYLDPTQLQQMMSYLQTLNSFVSVMVGNHAYSLSQFGVFVMLSEWISSYLKENPHATLEDLQSDLLDQLNGMPKGSLSPDQMKETEAIIAKLQQFFRESGKPINEDYPYFGEINSDNGYFSAYTPTEFIAENNITLHENTVNQIAGQVPDLALSDAQQAMKELAMIFTQQPIPKASPAFFNSIQTLVLSLPNLSTADQQVVKGYLNTLNSVVQVKMGNQTVSLENFSTNIVVLNWIYKDLGLDQNISLASLQKELNAQLKALPPGSFTKDQTAQALLVINNLPSAFGIAPSIPGLPTLGIISVGGGRTIYPYTDENVFQNNNASFVINGSTQSLQTAPQLPGGADVTADIAAIKAFAQASDPTPTPALFDAIADLSLNMSKMTTSQQKLVHNYLSTLDLLVGNASNSKGYTFSELVGLSVLNRWIDAAYKPNMTISQLQTAMQNQLASLPAGTLPPKIQSEMQKATDDLLLFFGPNPIPTGLPTFGNVIPLAPSGNNVVTQSPTIANVYSPSQFFSANGITFSHATPQSILEDTPTIFTPEQLQNMEQSLNQLIEDSKQLTQLYHLLQGARISSQIKYEAASEKSTSLQDLFQSAILNHYMPMQNKILQNTAAGLGWSNWQAQMYTTLIGDTTGFANASSIFTFNTMLSQGTPTAGVPGGDVYPGNPSSARAQVANELSSTNNFIKQSNQTITAINQYISQLENGTGGTGQFNTPSMEKQKTQLIVQLKGYRADLQTGILNLTMLRNVLESIQVIPSGNGFAINIDPPTNLAPATQQEIKTNWQSMLKQGEFAAANGAPGSPDSGLSNISQTFSSDEQKAENQSQNQQMQLQMTMTEVQQEWTIVSTSLQILNQMYMSVAKAIFSM